MACPRCGKRYPWRAASHLLRRCSEHASVVLVEEDAFDSGAGDPFLGMLIGGRFAVMELLGSGSMGTVYRARQEAVGRDVALKIVRSERLLDRQARARFRQEAHATSLLTSLHTVTVFDFGEVHVGDDDDPHFIDGSMYLAMELLTGESLGSRLERTGRVEPAEAVQIVRHALLSLGEAHENGVIHRDLKPDNLLLTSDNRGRPLTKVLDFGIAKVLSPQAGIDALETQAGTVFGTPRYMSPEQAQGKPLDARSDLYSLGVILYHMLVGKPPFTDGDAVVVMAHHIKTTPRKPSELDPSSSVPARLEALLMRVLAKEADRRPGSAAEMVRALDGLGKLDASAGSAELTAVLVDEPSAAAPLRLWHPRRALGAALAMLLAFALLAAADRSQRLDVAADASLVSLGLSVAVRSLAAGSVSLGKPSGAPPSADGLGAGGADGAPPAASAPAGSASAATVGSGKAGVPSHRRRGYQRFDR